MAASVPLVPLALSARREEACGRASAAHVGARAEDDPRQAPSGWHRLPLEVKGEIAACLSRTSHRAALCAVDRSAYAVAAPSVARDRLTRAAGQVLRLSQLHAIVGSNASASQPLEDATPTMAAMAAIGDLPLSLRARPLGVLAERIDSLPLEQKEQAFRIVFDQAQALRPRYRASLFSKLIAVVLGVPKEVRAEIYQALFGAARWLYRGTGRKPGREPGMRPADYAQFLSDATVSLPTLPEGRHAVLLQEFLDAVALLPRENQALPIVSLCRELGEFAPELRQPAYEDVRGKTRDMAPSQKVVALSGLIYAAFYFLPEQAECRRAIDQIFEDIVQLEPMEQGAVLKHLLPDAKQAAYMSAWETVPDLIGADKTRLLAGLAHGLYCLPYGDDRLRAFEGLISTSARLPPSEQGVVLAALAASVGLLHADERVRAFSHILELSRPSHGEHHQAVLHYRAKTLP